MEELHLKAQPREEIGKNKVSKLRNLDWIPAVIYSQGKKTQALKVSSRELTALLHGHRSENIIIKLDVQQPPDKVKEHNVLIKELQHDPVTEEILHIDFNEISLTKAINVKVPLVAKGEAIGIKQDGGSLEHLLWELEVECLPTQIPAQIEVDITNLKIGDAVHIKDLEIPKGVKVLHDPQMVVFSIAAPVKEEALQPAAGEEGALQEPEVIKEKKKEEEEGVKEEKPTPEKKPEKAGEQPKSAKEEKTK